MFRILQLTDLHVFHDAMTTLKGVPTRELLRDVVNFIAASGQTFDAVIVTGDHTHDELPESYQAVRQLLLPRVDRVFLVPGNNDERNFMRTVFGDRITGPNDELIQFSFGAGSWLCIGLDTHVPGAVAGRIDSAQIDWARDLVGRSSASQVALFFHHPPVLMNSDWMDAIGLEGRDLLMRWFQSDSRVRLVCCGHVHHEFQHRLGQVDILTTPSTGIQFAPEGSTPNMVAGPPGYRVIDLLDDGFSTRVIRLPEIRFRPVV
ncbi:MAG: metallophosphoesterase family protein [Planctomycetota bacterium]